MTTCPNQTEHSRAPVCMCSASSPPVNSSPPPWRKVLYEQQPYPDNYTDKSYLASVLTNVNQVPLSFPQLVIDSAVVTRQVSAVAIFCVFFLHTYYDRLSARPHLRFDAAYHPPPTKKGSLSPESYR